MLLLLVDCDRCSVDTVLMPKPLSTSPEKNEPVLLLTKSQARSIVDRINAHFNDARSLLLELYEREGWRALGYPSWRECAVAEFSQSQSRVYQLLDAARIERNLSTVVETSGQIPENTLRPLASLDNPADQRDAYKEAVKIAGDARVTHIHVNAGKDKILTERKARLSRKQQLADAWLVIQQIFGAKWAQWITQHERMTDDEVIEFHALSSDNDRKQVKTLMIQGKTFREAVDSLTGLGPQDKIEDLHTNAIQKDGVFQGQIGEFFHVVVHGAEVRDELIERLKGWKGLK